MSERYIHEIGKGHRLVKSAKNSGLGETGLQALKRVEAKEKKVEMAGKMKGKNEFEKWRSSRSGTHSKSISKKLGIKLYE